MKTSRRQFTQVNAGSMADIAFLLLIFFLVTAMIPNEEIGFKRTLPPPCPTGTNCPDGVKHQRNILEVRINSQNELLVEDEIVDLSELKDLTIAFLDNNGDGTCDYCNGQKSKTSSDSPSEAVISLNNDQLTSYKFYIKVQDELTKAYYELRSSYAKSVYNTSPEQLTRKQLQEVQNAYPFILSEAEIKQ